MPYEVHEVLMRWTDARGALICKAWGGYAGSVVQYDARRVDVVCRDLVVSIPLPKWVPDVRRGDDSD